jgi:hypothetical protein
MTLDSKRNNPFWNKHQIKQVSPQHHDSTIPKAKKKKEKLDEQEGQAPSLKSNSNDASLKHMGY